MCLSCEQACLLTIAAVLCIIGSYSTLNAAVEPVMKHTNNIAQGVSSAVGRAISKANQEAERHAMKHYEAREKYQSQRRLSKLTKRLDDDENLDQVESSAERTKEQRALLLKMAALLRTDTRGLAIDFGAIDQFFPNWRQQKQSHALNNDEVLKDLILAVSQLAHASPIDET